MSFSTKLNLRAVIEKKTFKIKIKAKSLKQRYKNSHITLINISFSTALFCPPFKDEQNEKHVK